ncbi:Crp/Fnr family transcriptional regulator [Cupriavidus basilensis]|uniref:Crp/Fnr family transcriptional regulator n=1 Tax=Cupriavidus basilensis TaxID=68895 RepID=A0ABT6AQK4_9BURK|nr:Crp/Fnr family transcriptional regulator [Cupriavidus basilensis]MDF3834026.1 Crp/Fnr family transcriptional regulator [Cupriavidus basilensis]
MSAMPRARQEPAPDPLRVLRGGSWFGSLPAPLQLVLLRDAITRKLSTGQLLFTRGDAFDGIYGVVAGTLQIDAHSASGKAALLGLLEPGSWFGEICLFDGLARTHDARATSAATVLHLHSDKLYAMLAAHPEWWREFGKLLAAKTREAFHYVEEAQLLPPLARTARRLVAIAQAYGNLPGLERRSVHIPQEQLGQMLGLSRQTVNQALRELEARGLLQLHYADIELLDLPALLAVA